ncbi:MAG: hypothetical protein AUH85_05200 [Chloroflexi bacterium 13_1_40CM_4_68_4]|nr:MAG: hypothetical protein AUH85_05200 [Chloroflexi bacterium 13_1_40CM_4_68_4]
MGGRRRQRVDVLGVSFDRVDLAGATDVILRRLDSGQRTFVVTANPEFVMLARRDEEIARIAREADLVIADGTGVVVGSRLLGDGLSRVAGRLGVSVYLLGASLGVAERAAAALHRRVPSLRIAGTYAGSADGESAARVSAAAPDVVFVAYGMPKQERWIERHIRSLPTVKIAIGVGGVFDQLAGVQRVPPHVVHRLGLEWLWRLANDPARWRRQRVLPMFAALVFRKRLLGR